MENTAVIFLEPLSDFWFETGRSESFPVEQITNFLMRRKTKIIDSSMNLSDVIGKHVQTTHQGSNKLHFICVKHIIMQIFYISQSLIYGLIKFVASVIVDRRVKLFNFESLFSSFADPADRNLPFFLGHLVYCKCFQRETAFDWNVCVENHLFRIF